MADVRAHWSSTPRVRRDDRDGARRRAGSRSPGHGAPQLGGGERLDRLAEAHLVREDEVPLFLFSVSGAWATVASTRPSTSAVGHRSGRPAARRAARNWCGSRSKPKPGAPSTSAGRSDRSRRASGAASRRTGTRTRPRRRAGRSWASSAAAATASPARRATPPPSESESLSSKMHLFFFLRFGAAGGAGAGGVFSNAFSRSSSFTRCSSARSRSVAAVSMGHCQCVRVLRIQPSLQPCCCCNCFKIARM